MLFQHVASLANLDRINAKTFTIVELRALLGVPEGKHKRFAELNRWTLKPAVSEINHLFPAEPDSHSEQDRAHGGQCHHRLAGQG